jgi:hypothetical protein
VHGGAVAVVALAVGVARGEVDGALDLLVEEGVAHGLEHVRVHAEGELAERARPLVRVQDLAELGLVLRRAGRGDPAALHLQPDVPEADPLVQRAGVVGDDAVHRVLDRGGEHLAVGDVQPAVALHGRHPADGELELGARPHQPHAVGALHPRDQRVHGPGQGSVVEVADLEVEVLEGAEALPGLEGHAGVGPAQHAPALLEPRVQVHLLLEVPPLPLLLLGGQVPLLEGVLGGAHAHVGVHALHDGLVEGAERLVLRLAGRGEEGLGELVVEGAPVGDRAPLGGEPDELLAERVGVGPDEIDVEDLARRDLQAVADEVLGELGDARVGSHAAFLGGRGLRRRAG